MTNPGVCDNLRIRVVRVHQTSIAVEFRTKYPVLKYPNNILKLINNVGVG